MRGLFLIVLIVVLIGCTSTFIYINKSDDAMLESRQKENGLNIPLDSLLDNTNNNKTDDKEDFR